MQAYLRDRSSEEQASSYDYEHPQVVQTRIKEVQDIAYEIEDELGKLLLHVPHQFHSNSFSQKMHELPHFYTMRKASREFSKKITYITESKINFVAHLDSIHRVHEIHTSSSATTLYHRRFLEEEEMVGFEEPQEKIIKQLMEGDSRLSNILIVGPPGSGKTTLMKNVFKSKKVQRFFDCHAWIDVPRDLCARQLDELLLNMLRKFDPKGKMQKPVLHEDPKAQLARLLKEKKFVAALDNVWRTEDLENILNALPNGFPGSKIFITTRNQEVANSLNSHSKYSYIHDLSKGLSWQDGWVLFCNKVFPDGQGSCPSHLLEWAEKILTRCEGLPLAISAVGTLLETKRPTPVEWKKLHDSLVSNLPIISQFLLPSYKDLPIHLKTCFLYFNMFPEDCSISHERLIRLWVAEGFVMPITGSAETIEEVAEGYLNELILRNLVHVTSREVNGRVRSCRVLNLVREFIIVHATNFIKVLSEANNSGTTSTSPGEKIRRLSIQNVELRNFSRGRELSCNRTIIVYGQAKYDSELERVLKTFKFLRLLDLEGVHLENFPDSVFGLTLLRYISLRQTKIKIVPRSIKKLGFLETLDLKHTQVTSLPEEVYALHNLRHLLVYHYDVKNYVTFGAASGVEVSVGNIEALSSIQKLSLIKVKNNSKLIRALGELRGLRKLGVVDLETQDGRELCCSVQKMQNLLTFDVRSTSEQEFLDLDHKEFCPNFLQRVYLKGRLERLPKWISQLHSVVKIGMKWSKLNANENPLEALEDLPNLMELNLVEYYNGENLVFNVEKFKKLKLLEIENFDELNVMVVQTGAMPKLKKLTMSRCQKLRLLPLGMESLKSLEKLLLYDMHNDFIAKLDKDSEDRPAVEHIRVIHAFHLGTNQSFTGFKNLS